MREPKPFFRNQTKSWYVQFGKDQIPLGRNEEEAWDKYRRLMDERRRGAVKSDESVATILNHHLAWTKDNQAHGTFKKKLRHLKSFGRYIGPKLNVSKLRVYHVQRWIDQEYAGRSSTYQHIAITDVQSALNWGVKLESPMVESMLCRIALIVAFMVLPACAQGAEPIDREALVRRHQVTVERFDRSGALQVGNGELAFAVDLTGLQTFDPQLGTYSQWGWHSFPKPKGVEYEHALREWTFHGRKATYVHP